MRNVTESTITDGVLEKFAGISDERAKTLLSAMIRHLHDFVREVEPTEEEWFAAIQFLNKAGQISDERRQEFMLLSDVLGVTILMDAINNNRKPSGATESSVLGPFYREHAPERTDIAPGQDGEETVVAGRVLDIDGKPIAGATLDVWQTAPNRLYESQDEGQPEFNLRGKIVTGADGRYAFRTVKPVSYPVPTDGPAGALLDLMERHAWRPAHLHFIVSAPGCEHVITMIFTEGDEYLDSDAVFGVKESLIVDYVEQEADELSRSLGVDGRHWRAEFDFVLAPEGASGRAQAKINSPVG
jgi:catechol 1,2-dioxygenase